VVGAALAIEGRYATLWRRVVTPIALGLVALNLAWVPAAGWILRDFRPEALIVPGGRELLLRQQVPQRELIAIVNALAGTAAHVAIFGEPVGAELEGEPLYTHNWYSWPFHSALAGARSSGEVHAVLEKRAVDFILVEDGSLDDYPAMSGYLATEATLIASTPRARLYRNEPPRRP